MKSLLLRSLLAAALIGPLVAFASTVASVRPGVRYAPGISQYELKSYDSRSVTDLEAFLQSREVKLTRSQWLRESIGSAQFWEGNAWKSVEPIIGIFLGCIIVGGLERRHVRVPHSATPN